MTKIYTIILSLLTVVAHGDNSRPLVPQSIATAVDIIARYHYVQSDITYSTSNNYDSKLDIYQSTAPGKHATLVFFHGGGWMAGASKASNTLLFLPFLQLGWNVVNVDYRPSSVSLAPGAVVDCLCALRWIALNAEDHRIDLNRIVLMGDSAGGHLALMTGMIPLGSSPLSGPCEFRGSRGWELAMVPAPVVKPVAIVNWYGITDVVDVYQGPNEKPYAALWIGNQPDRESIAKLVSPINYVRAGLPAIISIHGDQDPQVPYDHATRLHSSLDRYHVKNKLLTVPRGAHGSFGVEIIRNAFEQVFEFLSELGVPIQEDNSSS